MTRRVLLSSLLLLLPGCIEITTPPERAVDYLGEWTGANVTLTIRGKRIVYRKRGGGFGSKYVDAGFLGLSGNDVVYGGQRKGRIRVSVPPHREGAVWKMTIEEIEVQRPTYDGPAGSQAH